MIRFQPQQINQLVMLFTLIINLPNQPPDFWLTFCQTNSQKQPRWTRFSLSVLVSGCVNSTTLFFAPFICSVFDLLSSIWTASTLPVTLNLNLLLHIQRPGLQCSTTGMSDPPLPLLGVLFEVKVQSGTFHTQLISQLFLDFLLIPICPGWWKERMKKKKDRKAGGGSMWAWRLKGFSLDTFQIKVLNHFWLSSPR